MRGEKTKQQIRGQNLRQVHAVHGHRARKSSASTELDKFKFSRCEVGGGLINQRRERPNRTDDVCDIETQARHYESNYYVVS